jgi:hypothetical protein
MERALFIVAIVFGSIWLSHYLRYLRKRMDMKLAAEKEFTTGLKSELEEIRQRLANLEKIITDKGYRVREEIDRL